VLSSACPKRERTRLLGLCFCPHVPSASERVSWVPAFISISKTRVDASHGFVLSSAYPQRERMRLVDLCFRPHVPIASGCVSPVCAFVHMSQTRAGASHGFVLSSAYPKHEPTRLNRTWICTFVCICPSHSLTHSLTSERSCFFNETTPSGSFHRHSGFDLVFHQS
jgi:hypothetical protein